VLDLLPSSELLDLYVYFGKIPILSKQKRLFRNIVPGHHDRLMIVCPLLAIFWSNIAVNSFYCTQPAEFFLPPLPRVSRLLIVHFGASLLTRNLGLYSAGPGESGSGATSCEPRQKVCLGDPSPIALAAPAGIA
jgi:hypothetical protein